MENLNCDSMQDALDERAYYDRFRLQRRHSDALRRHISFDQCYVFIADRNPARFVRLLERSSAFIDRYGERGRQLQRGQEALQPFENLEPTEPIIDGLVLRCLRFD